LTKDNYALTFQVLEQSPDITAFLSQTNFQAKNGMTIGISEYPEFKQSKNTIFLRGSNKGNDFKPDVTMFVGNMQRDNQYDMFIEAIQDLVDTVKKAFVPTPVSYGRIAHATPYGNVIPSCPNVVTYTTVKSHKRRVANSMPNVPMFVIQS
jgi:hypothetical protein